MKDQVTSVEQSKHLLGIGIPSTLSSMSWVRVFERTGDSDDKTWGSWQLSINPVDPKVDQEVIPAFTVGDLIRMLPPEEDIYNLVIGRSPNLGWDVRYNEHNSLSYIWPVHGYTLVNALVEMVEKVKKEEDEDPFTLVSFTVTYFR